MKTLLIASMTLLSLDLAAAEIPSPVLASYEGLSGASGVAFGADGTYLSDPISQSLVLYGTDGQRQVVAGGLNSPAGLAVDENGVAWVADGSVVRSFRSNGSAGLVLGAGLLGAPSDVAVGAENRLYVTDAAHHRVVVFDRSNGELLFHFGRSGYSALNEMSQPMGLDVKNGEVFVADAGNGRVLVFDLEGAPLRQMGVRGSGPAAFDSPFDVVVDGLGQVWVADNGAQAVQVLAMDGSFLAGFGPSFDGQPFQDLSHLCLSPLGEVLVTDGSANRSYAWAAPAAEPMAASLFSFVPEEEPSRSLASASLLAGPVPARAGEPLYVSLPFNVDRLKVQVFSADMRGAGSDERSQVSELAFTGTQDLPAGVYFMKVTAELGLERKEKLQKIIITR